MSNEDHSPRPNDHLVEPLFAGLGLDDDERQKRDPDEKPEHPAPPEAPGLWRRIVGWLRLGSREE